MALLAMTSLAGEGRGPVAVDEHQAIVTAISVRNGAAAYQAVRQHLSQAFITRLQHDAGE